MSRQRTGTRLAVAAKEISKQQIRAQFERAAEEVRRLRAGGADAPYDEGIADALGWVLGERDSPYQNARSEPRRRVAARSAV